MNKLKAIILFMKTKYLLQDCLQGRIKHKAEQAECLGLTRKKGAYKGKTDGKRANEG